MMTLSNQEFFSKVELLTKALKFLCVNLGHFYYIAALFQVQRETFLILHHKENAAKALLILLEKKILRNTTYIHSTPTENK